MSLPASRPARVATADDAVAITALVNSAFRVEDFFKVGDRTTLAEVAEHFSSGEFLVVDGPGEGGDGLAACVYLERHGTQAYFGMLSIDPTQQGRGLGRQLIDALEQRCRDHGCREVEIHVVNLREELPPFYRRFGYLQTGTLPFPDDGSSTVPCHFIVMKKTLA